MKNVARNIVSKVQPSNISKMKISHLLFLGCFLYVSVYDVRGNVDIIIDEFKRIFKEYVKEESSELSCLNVLKNLNNMCPCAIKQIQNIQEGFDNQNSSKVILMNENLNVLTEQLKKSGKSKNQTKQRRKREECKFECRDFKSAEKNIDNFFSALTKRRCFKGSRK